MRILQLTTHFSPNVGGVETHLTDLVFSLTDRNNEVFVLTYRPLTANVGWKVVEKKKRLVIFRLPWIPGFFYKLIENPVLEFLYLLPGIFFFTPFVMVNQNSKVIHSHGLVAGFAGVFWGRVFRKRVLTTTHSIYNFPKKGLYNKFAKWIFENSDCTLTLSKQSKKEIVELGVAENKVRVFTYWVDLAKFKPISNAKKSFKWRNKFVVLFVGRLLEEKGLLLLLESAKNWNKNIMLVIAGSGPLESEIRSRMSEVRNIEFLGKIANKKLPIFYSAADLVIVPSIHEEGFGRVILESLACGTPVIGARRGAIPEAMTDEVGKLIAINPESIKKAVEFFYGHPTNLKKLARNARKFAQGRYSEKNADTIIKAYTHPLQNKLEKLLVNTLDTALKRRSEALISALNPRDGDKIIDVGCGDGFYLHLLSNLDLKLNLTGADFDVRALGSAKRNLAGKKIRLLKGDLMSKLPFENNSFDKAIMSEVAEHLPEDVKGLKEVYRVLKPGGIACITVPHANYPFFWDPINWMLEHLFDTHIKSGFFAGIWNQHERLYEKDQIKKVIEKAGFSVDEQKFITWWCLPFNHYLINIGARILAKGGNENLTEGANKFASGEKRSLIPGIYFTISNAIDKLNDIVPIPSGVSIVTLAKK